MRLPSTTLTVAAVLFAAALSSSVRAQHDDHDLIGPKLKLTGFSDVNFYAGDDSDPDASSGFRDGQFVLHFVSELSSRFDFFGEVSLTAKDTEYAAEVERLVIKYTYNDYLKLSAGRFHTPVNWWNTAFHHGSWLQTSIDRPQMTRFGGEFIPVHFVGVLAEGNVPSGPAHLAYIGGVGNGRADNIARAGDAGDVNNNRAVLVKLYARPARPYRLEVGASYYLDKVTTQGLEDFDEQLASAYVVWAGETPEVIAEYARLEDESTVSDLSAASTAGYVQAAYRLRWLNRMLKPYARYETIDVDEDDPIFTTLTDLSLYLVGLRADVAPFVALKGEWRHQKFADLPFDDAFYAQVCFVF